MSDTMPATSPEQPPLTRDSFRKSLQSFSRPCAMSALPARGWTAEQWSRLRLGHRAASMDEKWHVFAEGDTLHLHRSWTGFQAFEATFTPAVDDAFRHITAGRAEADPERVRSPGAEADAVMLELVLSAIMIGEDVPKLWERYGTLLRQGRRRRSA